MNTAKEGLYTVDIKGGTLTVGYFFYLNNLSLYPKFKTNPSSDFVLGETFTSIALLVMDYSKNHDVKTITIGVIDNRFEMLAKKFISKFESKINFKKENIFFKHWVPEMEILK